MIEGETFRVDDMKRWRHSANNLVNDVLPIINVSLCTEVNTTTNPDHSGIGEKGIEEMYIIDSLLA